MKRIRQAITMLFGMVLISALGLYPPVRRSQPTRIIDTILLPFAARSVMASTAPQFEAKLNPLSTRVGRPTA